jgi:predicted GNAT family acetyltransferase
LEACLSIQEQADQMKNDRRFNYFHSHSISTFKPKDLIILKREDGERGVNPKLLSRNLGPFEVVSVDNNNITIQLTPLETLVIHQDKIGHYTGPLKPFPTNYFTPNLSEIILLPIPERKKEEKVRLLPDSRKKEFDLKSIVGKKVNHYWPSVKKWYSGTIIGYNKDLTHNLIYYDEPTLDVIPSCDFYKVFLFKSSKSPKVDTWSLIQ